MRTKNTKIPREDASDQQFCVWALDLLDGLSPHDLEVQSLTKLLNRRPAPKMYEGDKRNVIMRLRGLGVLPPSPDQDAPAENT